MMASEQWVNELETPAKMEIIESAVFGMTVILLIRS